MPSSSSASLYHTLDIRTNATKDEIKRAYRIKALETHPDKLDPGASERGKARARAQFQRVHEAFQILNDPDKRQAYDREHLQSCTLPLRQPERSVSSTTRNEETRSAEDQSERVRVNRPPGDTPSTFQPRPRSQALNLRDSELRSMPVSRPTQRRQQEVQDLSPNQYKEFVDSILEAVIEANPEWEERRRRVLQLKLEREKNGTPRQVIRS